MRKKIGIIFILTLFCMIVCGTVAYADTCSQCGEPMMGNAGWDSKSSTQHGHLWRCSNGHEKWTDLESHSYGGWSSSGGTHSKKCTYCGYTQSSHTAAFDYKKISETQHQAQCDYCTLTNGTRDHVASTAATCTTAAYCATCRSYFGGVDSNNHSWGAWVEESSTQHKRTCTRDASHVERSSHTDGNGDGKCDTCGYQMHVHNFNVWQSSTPGNCVTRGTITYKCNGCAQTQTVDGEFGDHSWYEERRTDATCTENGTIYYKCRNSSAHTTTGTIPALNHAPGSAATCTTNQTCTRCGAVLANALGHAPGSAATCTTNQTCTRCGAVLANALGHAPGSAATCTTNQTCTRCGAILANALGHAPGSAATCTTNQTCTRCGAILAYAFGHNWYETGRTDSTCTATGIIYYSCRNNSAHTKTETIEMKSHTWPTSYSQTSTQHYKNCTVCSGRLETGNHADYDNNGYCDTCGYNMRVTPTLTISPDPLLIVYGSTGTFTYRYNGDAIPTITVGSSTIATASINTSANTITVNTANVGDTVLTISCAETSKYFYTYATATIRVTRQPITVPTGTNFTYDGTQHTGLSSTVQYTAGGTYYATNAGSYTATATPTANYMWTDGGLDARNVSWSITAKSLTAGGMNATLNQTSYVYDGNPKTPGVTVTDGSKTLTPGTDYTVKYENNKDAGRGKVTVTGQGNYQGSITLEFDITRQPIGVPTGTNFTYDGTQHTGLSSTVQYTAGGTYYATNAGSYTATATPTANYMWTDGGLDARNVSWSIIAKSLTAGDIKATLDQTSYVYDGNPKTPGVTVTDGSKTLTPGTDYTVKYESNTNAGKGKVTVTGQGNYQGSITVEFEITRQPIAKPIATNKTYNRAEQIGVPEGTGYVLSGNPRATNQGTYYVTVTLDSNYQWNDYTILDLSLSWIISPKNIADEDVIKNISLDTKTYNQNAQTQSVTLTHIGATLQLNTEYTVGYTNNVNVGTATITVTGQGNYTGTVTKYFTINPKSFTAGDIQSSLSETTYEYDKQPKTPGVTVQDGGKVLTGVDYDVRYENNTEVGTAKVVITGKGNYEGTIEKEFTIQDTTPPSIPIVTAQIKQAGGETYVSGTWTNQNIYISLQSTDYSVFKYQYRIGTTGEWQDMPAGGVKLYEDEMNQEFYYRAIDIYNNASAASTGITLRIDKTNPNVGTLKAQIRDANGIDYDFGTVSEKSIYVALDSLGSDDASGVRETTYTIDQVDDEDHNKVIKNIVTNETTAKVLADGGTYRVTVTTIDVAGNSTTSKPYIIIIERNFTNIIRINDLYDVGSGIKDITLTITKRGESKPTYTEQISTYQANFVKRVKLLDGVFDIIVVIQDRVGNSKTLTKEVKNVIW